MRIDDLHYIEEMPWTSERKAHCALCGCGLVAGCDETACACIGIGRPNGQLSAALFVSQ